METPERPYLTLLLKTGEAGSSKTSVPVNLATFQKSNRKSTLNLIYLGYIKNCWMNLILVHIGPIQPSTLYEAQITFC
jgi:hypothetical protein